MKNRRMLERRVAALEARTTPPALPRNATLPDCWPLVAWCLRAPLVWRFRPSLRWAGPVPAYRTAAYRHEIAATLAVAFPGAGLTLDDIDTVATILNRADHADQWYCPFWPEEIDQVATWLAEDRIVERPGGGWAAPDPTSHLTTPGPWDSHLNVCDAWSRTGVRTDHHHLFRWWARHGVTTLARLDTWLVQAQRVWPPHGRDDR